MANTINVNLTDTFEIWRTKTNEIGTAVGDLDNLNLAGESGEDTVIDTLNNLRSEADDHESWIGNINNLHTSHTDLTSASNANKADIDTIALAGGIDLVNGGLSGYNGSESAAVDIFNAHLSAIQSNDSDILTLQTDLNTAETDIVAIETDIGDFSTYTGSQSDITSVLNDFKTALDGTSGTYVDATGDTMTGDLYFTSGGVQASGQYLNLGVGGTQTIRINTSNRIGIGKAAHTSYKMDVSGTLNATELRVGGQDTDDRYIMNSTGGGTSTIGSDIELSGDVTISQKLLIGSETVFDDSAFSFSEYIEDVAGNMFELNAESGGIAAAYNDTTGKITLSIADDGHNHVIGNIDNFTEEVQDIVGNMISNNSESGISVDYDDITGTLDFNVNDPTITLTGDVTGSATMSNLGSITIATTVGSNNVALGTDTTGNYVKQGATSGNGISGSVNSEGGTFTVTSNATSNNTASTIIFRDASGDFAAGSASLTGLSVTNDATFNGNITVNADDAASTIVMGDSDEGNRTIKNDSNQIGFLKQDGAWAAYADDNGNWTAAGDITASGGDMYATYFHGQATSATYADLAENYVADDNYQPGTVLVLGGEEEVTQAVNQNDRAVIGVVSTQPAHLMNSGLQGPMVVAVALVGRVPCKVTGPIKKGDLLVSAGHGAAMANNNPQVGTVIGKALEDSDGENVIEVVVGKL